MEIKTYISEGDRPAWAWYMDVHARVMGGTRCGPASSDGRNVTNDVLLGSCLLGGEVCLMLVYWGSFLLNGFEAKTRAA